MPALRASAAATRVARGSPPGAPVKPVGRPSPISRRSGPARTKLGTEPVHPADNNGVCSRHPDAIKRRVEQLEWQRQRAAEKMSLSSLGSHWYDAPSTMVACSSADQYRDLVAQAAAEGKLLVAKFYTSDCYVCKSLYPKVKKIASDNPDVLWAKLNGSDPELVSLFHNLGITKVPLFHMVLDGQLVSELTASLSPEKLAAFRAELAAHKPAPSAPTGSSSSESCARPAAEVDLAVSMAVAAPQMA